MGRSRSAASNVSDHVLTTLDRPRTQSFAGTPIRQAWLQVLSYSPTNFLLIHFTSCLLVQITFVLSFPPTYSLSFLLAYLLHRSCCFPHCLITASFLHSTFTLPFPQCHPNFHAPLSQVFVGCANFPCP